MTEQEAIKFLTGYLDSVVYKEKCVEAHKLAIKALEENQQYRAIGTPEECREAVEKQNEKKVLKPLTSYSQGTCPVCAENQMGRWGYCRMCGQKLDWSDME